ncbi:hypothetical protein ACGFT2_20260 [Streptomyces sp. NPDC048514]|uniref:hypothetical protein n=1 Tax=Streptomyces sp. NPDC048514 TaxID=3365564 RepID=UPI0037206912
MRKFPQRHHAVRLGGFVRTAGSSPDHRSPRAPAREAHSRPGRTPVALRDATGPPDGVPDSTTGRPDDVQARRVPAYARPPGCDRGVFDLGAALRRGGDPAGSRLVSQWDAAWAGGLFAAVDVRQ